MNRTLNALLLIGALAISCVPKPQSDYTPEQARSLPSVEEAMRVNALYADPMFSIRGESSFTAEQYRQMTTAADYLEATSDALIGDLGNSYGEGFTELAATVKAEADKLRSAAEAQDAATASAALEAIKSACAGCHSSYR